MYYNPDSIPTMTLFKLITRKTPILISLYDCITTYRYCAIAVTAIIIFTRTEYPRHKLHRTSFLFSNIDNGLLYTRVVLVSFETGPIFSVGEDNIKQKFTM